MVLGVTCRWANCSCRKRRRLSRTPLCEPPSEYLRQLEHFVRLGLKVCSHRVDQIGVKLCSVGRQSVDDGSFANSVDDERHPDGPRVRVPKPDQREQHLSSESRPHDQKSLRGIGLPHPAMEVLIVRRRLPDFVVGHRQIKFFTGSGDHLLQVGDVLLEVGDVHGTF
jgi:hypothetical protein